MPAKPVPKVVKDKQASVVAQSIDEVRLCIARIEEARCWNHSPPELINHLERSRKSLLDAWGHLLYAKDFIDKQPEAESPPDHD